MTAARNRKLAEAADVALGVLHGIAAFDDRLDEMGPGVSARGTGPGSKGGSSSPVEGQYEKPSTVVRSQLDRLVDRFHAAALRVDAAYGEIARTQRGLPAKGERQRIAGRAPCPQTCPQCFGGHAEATGRWECEELPRAVPVEGPPVPPEPDLCGDGVSITLECTSCAAVVMLPLMPAEPSRPDDPPMVSFDEAEGWTAPPVRCPNCSSKPTG